MIIIKSTCLLFIIYTFLKNIKKLYKKSHLLTNQEIFETNKTIIQSHRGINREILENTMESFIKALDLVSLSVDSKVKACVTALHKVHNFKGITLPF